MGEPKVPLSVVKLMLDQQNSFNQQLVEKLGLFIAQAAEKYERALNPPIPEGHTGEMTTTRWGEDAEDLEYQIEAGIIPQNDISDAMRRILSGTDTVIDIP